LQFAGAMIKYLMIPLYINCVEIKCIAAAAGEEEAYRIYSRIGREILDNFGQYFFQFDLYTGHQL
jgi:hypothetical protein